MILASIEDDIPIFGKIIDIIITVPSTCLFVLVPYVGDCFCKHFNAYEVYSKPSHYLICEQKHFVDYHPLTLSRSFSHSLSCKLYVCLKYAIL